MLLSTYFLLAGLYGRLLVGIRQEAKMSPARLGWDCCNPSPPSARKVDASPSRPFSPPGGLMEPFNASLQRDRKS